MLGRLASHDAASMPPSLVHQSRGRRDVFGQSEGCQSAMFLFAETRDRPELARDGLFILMLVSYQRHAV